MSDEADSRPTRSFPAESAVPEGPLRLREPDDDTPPSPADGVGLPARVGRYEVVRLIAQGGMGAVYRVRDPELGRSLALKVLLACHQERPDLTRRFLEEAQIGAQLQHPGLVPLHEMGTLPDGRPFFAMKLVRGTTLADLLNRRTSPAEELPRFLAVFEQVCQTLAYAHSRGVIHRDLKPSNVMVGNFGEVQVMDWGLAKLLGRQGPAPTEWAAGASTMHTSRSGEDDSATRAGTVLGTPAYMPPEQARGQVDHLDERADVFGLGAMLCEILTGRPPYAGAREHLIAQAAQGDLAEARARLAGCGADAELVNLALRCLAFQPLERPANAAAVAEAMTAYHAGVQERARRAELEKAAAHAKAAEQRKRRWLWRGLVFLVVTVAAGAGTGWLWLQSKQAATEQEVEIALEKAAQLQAEEKWTEALAAARQAEGLLEGGGSAALKARVARRVEEIALVKRLDEIQLELADATGNYLLAFDTTANQVGGRLLDAEYTKALKQFGLDVDDLTVGQTVERLKPSPAVRLRLLAVLDNWAIARRRSRPGDAPAWQRLFTLARELDPDPWRNRLRDALALNDLAGLRTLAEKVDVASQPPAALRTLGEELARLGDYPAGIAVLRQAQRQYPGNVLLNARLARLLHSQRPQQIAEALRFATTAVALRPRSPGLLVEYAYLLSLHGRLDESIANLEKALQVKPEHAVAMADLAFRLAQKGEKERSQAACSKALELFRQAIDTDPENDLHHYDEGLCLRYLGDPDSALKAYRKAVKLNPTFSDSHTAIASLQQNLGLLDEAVDTAQAAARLDPKDHILLNHTAFHLMDQGGALDEAREVIRRSLSLHTNAENQLTLAEVLRAQGKIRESLEAYELGYRLHESGPQRWDWSPEVGQWLKDARRLKDLDDRLPAVLKGTDKPASPAEALEFGQLCIYMRLFATAARFYKDAFALDPKLAENVAGGARHLAAVAAAQAGCGRGADAPDVGEQARAAWRTQALAWMTADLAFWDAQVEKGSPSERLAARQTLNRWRTHAHLECVRPAALGMLPEPERLAWQRFWDDVAVLVKKAKEK